MKLLMNENQELADIDLDVNPATGLCTPTIDACGYRIKGPLTKVALEKDDATEGLRLTLELPGITKAAVLIEREDVKKIKVLMNKDAIKFMVKALM